MMNRFPFCLVLLLISGVISVFAEDPLAPIADQPVDINPVPVVDLGKITLSTDYASVKFTDGIQSSLTLQQLEACLITNKDSIKVDTQSCPELEQEATITFYDINLTKPLLFHNGIYRPDVFVLKLNDTTYTAHVEGFSEWTLSDNHWGNGTFGNTTIINGNLQDKSNTAIYMFDYETNTEHFLDKSGNGVVSNLRGGINFDPGAGYGGSNTYSFDGVNDQISNGFIPQQNQTANGSLWLHVDFNSNYTGIVQQMVSARTGSGGEGYGASISAVGRISWLTVITGASNRDCTPVIGNFTGTGWHRADFIYRANNTKEVWIDGAVNFTCGEVGAYFNQGFSNITIGAISGTQFFKGFLDNIWVINASPTQAQIVAYNNSPKTILPIYSISGLATNWTSQVYNVSNLFPSAIGNQVKGVTISGNQSNLTVYGRNSSTPINILTQPWVVATNTSGNWNWTPALNGSFFQVRFDSFTQGNDTMSLINFTILSNSSLVDINPSFQFVFPTLATNSYTTNHYVVLNTSTDSPYVGNVTHNLYYINNSLFNTSTIFSPQVQWKTQFFNVPDGQYRYNATILDVAGTYNLTETRNITIDSTNPLVNFTFPTPNNNTVLSTFTITFNGTCTDANFANCTYYLYNSTGSVIAQITNTTSSNLAQFTVLTNGVYPYDIVGYDLVGNNNRTERRQVVVSVSSAPPVPTQTNLWTLVQKMDLVLWVTLFSLGVALVVLGFWRNEHTELVIVGFFIMFIMSLFLIGNYVQYKTGFQGNTTYVYNGMNASLTSSQEVSRDVYHDITAGSTLSHRIGYFLAIGCAVGMIGTIIDLRRTRWRNTN